MKQENKNYFAKLLSLITNNKGSIFFADKLLLQQISKLKKSGKRKVENEQEKL